MTRAIARIAVGAISLLVAPMPGRATAQERPQAALEFAAGWIGFADDGIVSEGLVGGAARWYLLPRVSVGPEIVYIGGSSHSHLAVTGNVTWDVVGSTGSRTPRLTPFVTAGAGLFRTRESFPSGAFTSNEGAFTAGGGLRGPIGNRVTVGIDARVGWELHLRINGLIGVRLGP